MKDEYKKFRESYLGLPVVLVTLISYLVTLAFFSPLTASAAVLSQPPNNLGLVGYWPFEEDEGTEAGDFSGNQNHGTLTGDPQLKSGIRGGALDFDGNDDYVRKGSPSNLPSGNAERTLSMWVSYDSLNLGDVFGGYGDDATDENFQIGINTGNDRIRLYVWGGNDHITDIVASDYADGDFHHFVLTHDGTTVRIYIDGEFKTSVDITLATDPTEVCIAGEVASGSCDRWFDGQIDDVRIYNRALSASEVAELYRAGHVTYKSPDTGGLVGHWTFDEGEGDEAGDFSGNQNHGTLTGDPQWTSGIRGGALDFDGTGDYVSAGDLGSGVQSISFWMRASDVTSQTLINIDGTDHIETDGSDQVNAASFPSATVYVDGAAGTGVRDETWHHVVVTDSSGVSASTFEIGRLDPDYFTGKIDDVRVFTKALTADEVSALYNLGQATQKRAPTRGLVGYWPFEEGEGTEAGDFSGNQNHGTLTGMDPATDWVSGKLGRHALDFDGDNDYVQITDTEAMPCSIGGTCSVAMWVKGPAQETKYFWGQNNSAGGNTLYNLFADNTVCLGKHTGALCIQIRNTSGTSPLLQATAATVFDDSWHHIVWVDNAGTGTMYVDGVADTNNFNYTPSGSIISNVSCLGALCRSSVASHADISLDDVRVYNRAITAEEARRLYRIGR